MNLLNSVKEDLTDSLVDHLSDMVGLSSNDTGSALDIFLSGLLGGIAHKGSSIQGANTILDIIKRNSFDRDDTFDLAKIFNADKKISDYLETGTNLLKSLFGNKKEGLIDLLTRKSGLNNTIGSKLLSFLTPIAIKKIAVIVGNHDFDAKALSDFFSNENKDLLGMIPGLGILFSKPDKPKRVHSIEGYDKVSEKKKNRLLKWILPLLFLVGLLWGIITNRM